MQVYNRREWLGGLAALTACAPKLSPPNVLLVVADDQSWPHAGAYGFKNVSTPAFDRIASEGVLFTHSFSACPSCTPSRTALLTGRHIWQTGEAGVLYGTMPPNMPLFPHALADAGYRTGFTGKGWGPGDWQAAGLKRHPIGREYNAKKHKIAVPPAIDERDYAANFEQFLDDGPSSSPFFFWLGSTEPHRLYDNAVPERPVEVPTYLPDTPEVRRDLSAYLSEIEWYDKQLARVLKLLEDRHLLDNTLIIVTSDNGLPFPRAKVNLYDAGLRMPLAIRYGAKGRGQRCDALVAHTDISATILDVAKLPPLNGAVGKSLLPLLDKPDDAVHNHVIAGLERHVMARPDGATYPCRRIRTKDYLYIRNFAPDRWPTGGDFLSSNRTPHGDIDGAPAKDVLLDPANASKFARQIALAIGKRPAEELYDLKADPEQLNNIASSSPAKAAELWTLLQRELKATGDPRIDGRDPWQAYPYRQTTGYGASFNTTLSEERRKQAREAPTHKPE